METLPHEILLHIITFLEAQHILPLKLVSKRILRISRDTEVWKRLCFDDSHLAIAQKRQDIGSGTPIPIPEPRVFELQRAITRSIVNANLPKSKTRPPRTGSYRERSLANWDPSYPSERVDWYSEYIARHAPLSINWLQQPRDGIKGWGERREIRGVAFKTEGGNGLVVGPLDDGSLCLWNIGRNDDVPNPNHGRIVARSGSGLLTANGPERAPDKDFVSLRLEPANHNIIESISVDGARNRAYVAVHRALNEIDLETLQLISHQRYSSSISAISSASYPIPLTISTSHNLYIHDPRLPQHNLSDGFSSERLEKPITLVHSRNDMYRIPGSGTLHCSVPFSYGPLSILHLPNSDGAHDGQNGSIYVAGRFPSILVYDRRNMSKLSHTIYSGARLSSLSALVGPSIGASAASPSPHQTTIIACGEYNGKGSLELYRLPPLFTVPSGTPTPPSEIKNRTSASSSKLLSVTPHGTRLLFTDSNGMFKWVERDGSTLVRRWNINEDQPDPTSHSRPCSIFRSPAAGAGDVARKILRTGDSDASRDEVLFWTGERVGLLGFRRRPRFGADGWAEEDGVDEGEAGLFAERMRRALERQADEARFVRGLGLVG